MATFVDDEEELWQTCPFDATHIISKRRYSIHLLKCPKRNQKGMKLCPYNAQHHIESHLLEKHIAECDDRHQFERSAYEEYLFRAQNNGKCFIYGESEKKKEFESEEVYEKAVEEEKEEVNVVIPGLQEKVTVEDLAERFEDSEMMPSSYAMQRLPKVSRKKLLQMLLAAKKAKDIEADNDLNNGTKCDTSKEECFYEAWNLNNMNKVHDKQNIANDMKKNVDSEIKAEKEQYSKFDRINKISEKKINATSTMNIF